MFILLSIAIFNYLALFLHYSTVVCKEHDLSLLLELYNFSILLYPI